jgi:hypothetical protein
MSDVSSRTVILPLLVKYLGESGTLMVFCDSPLIRVPCETCYQKNKTCRGR